MSDPCGHCAQGPLTGRVKTLKFIFAILSVQSVFSLTTGTWIGLDMHFAGGGGYEGGWLGSGNSFNCGNDFHDFDTCPLTLVQGTECAL